MHFKLASAIGLLVAALACTDISRSPVGEELLPQGVLDGELELVVVTDWDLRPRPIGIVAISVSIGSRLEVTWIPIQWPSLRSRRGW